MPRQRRKPVWLTDPKAAYWRTRKPVRCPHCRCLFSDAGIAIHERRCSVASPLWRKHFRKYGRWPKPCPHCGAGVLPKTRRRSVDAG